MDTNVISGVPGTDLENENPLLEKELTEYKSFAKRSDPVAIYLKDIGSFPLLTREEEIEIARRVKAGKQDVLHGLLNCPMALREIINLGKKLDEGTMKLADLTNQVDDEGMTAKQKESHKKRVLDLIDRIRQGKDRIQVLQRKGKQRGDKLLKRKIQEKISNQRAEMFDALEQVDLKKEHVKRIVFSRARKFQYSNRSWCQVNFLLSVNVARYLAIVECGIFQLHRVLLPVIYGSSFRRMKIFD